METPRFSYTFDWRRAEHAEVTAFLVRELFLSGVARAFQWIAFAAVALAVLLAVAGAASGDLGPALRIGPLAVAVIVLLLGFGRITGWMRAWQLGRNDPNVGAPFTFAFFDDHLTIRLKTLKSDLAWDGLHAVGETPTMFLFYYSPRAAYFLPKRAVGHDAAELRAWIEDRLPGHVPFRGTGSPFQK